MPAFDGKICLVTGAARGIGAAIAEALAAGGATTVVTDLDEAGAMAAAAAIGPPSLGMRLDITDPGCVRDVLAQVRDRFGGLDILVNNAGWDKAGPFVDSTPEEWDRIIAINLMGPIRVIHAALPLLTARGRASIVNIGSDAGRVGSSGEAVYSAAKGGVIAFTKTLARELARYNVNVNCVCPGPTDTALFAEVVGENPKLRDGLIRAIPLRRLAEPAEVAATVAFLASDAAAYLTGQTVSVSGGLTMC
ncbi:MAG TPA: SDR family oxidoreductase [Sporichthyaceae bacterium]|jgi:2-hydroxycyclohexanecarboxyl-CoA dehydrogenase|nr:SDR family oxidoreductase [Sporichthyaceae bacterium]